ncbi:MAG TPA: prepilin-type N-terminal cleavage/methylation domain-containing protein [Bryobacteraceae bacterium]|nr:prepilin-type N-terminal cleavage/methylation domain-containing protein [Bryobacteraceae bacterium]
MLPDRTRRRKAGFSLIELLIVIAIILIILAVALPKLTKARTYAQEMAAVKAITTIHTAETQYYSQYGQYATSLNQLGPPTSGTANASGAELIDKELANGEKGNFKFTLQPSQTGYTLTAIPTQFGTSGTHTYYSDQSMAIHQHSGQEPATVNDPLVGEKEQQQTK